MGRRGNRSAKSTILPDICLLEESMRRRTPWPGESALYEVTRARV